MIKKIGMTICAALIAVSLPAGTAAAEMLTLDKAVSLALDENPALNAYRMDASAGKWGQAASISAWLPKVYFDTTYTRLDPDTYDKIKKSDEKLKQATEAAGGDTSSLSPSGYEDSYTSSIQVVQPIFNGGAELAGIHAATMQKRLSEEQSEDTTRSTVNKVKTAWFEAQRASALESTSAEALDLARETLKLTQARFDIGQVSRAEVLRWESQAAQAQGDLLEAGQTLRLARLNLNALIGVDLNAAWEFPEMDLNESVAPSQADPLNTTLDVPDFQTLKNHPGLRAMDATVGLAESSRYSAVTTVLPSLNFAFSYDWETNDTTSLDGEESWTAMATLEIPLFQSLGGAFGIMESHRSLQASRLRRDGYRREFLQRAYSAQLGIRTASQRVEAARRELAFADENRKTVQARQNLGAATNLDLLDAQVAYIQAKTRLVSALADMHIAASEQEYVSAK